MEISYDNRRFVPISNSEAGDAGNDTIFHYRQEGRAVWGTYRGGSVVCGTLLAKVAEDNSLDMRFLHLNSRGEFMTGVCRSTPEILEDGRIRLHEVWRFDAADRGGGEAVIEEIRDV